MHCNSAQGTACAIRIRTAVKFLMFSRRADHSLRTANTFRVFRRRAGQNRAGPRLAFAVYKLPERAFLHTACFVFDWSEFGLHRNLWFGGTDAVQRGFDEG
jgi:hypothetical protein